MEGYPPGFFPNGEARQETGRSHPDFVFRTLPFPPPPGFPYPRPRPLVGSPPFHDQLRPVPFNVAAAPYLSGRQNWFPSEPQGLLPFPGPPGRKPFRGKDNSLGPWLQSGSQQPDEGFGRAGGRPEFSGGSSRPAWVEDILAEHSAAPGRNRRSQGQGQGQGQAGGRTPGQGLAQDAQKRGKDEEGPGRPAKRARNGEKEERDAQRSARNGERGPGEAAFRQNDNPGSTAKTVKAVGLRSSETDARKERGSQLSGERGASTNRGVVEESQKRSTEERSESQGGVRASQRAAERAAERSEGRKTGDPLRDPPGKSDVGRKQEGSQTVVPGVRDVSSPPGFQDSRVFQLSTPLQRHRESSTPQKSSPLADAIKQKVQLWQSAKAGATSAGGVRVDHEVSGSAGVVNLGHGESDRREGFNTSHGRHVHTRREGAIHTDQRGGLNTNRERGPVTDAQAVRRPSPSDGNSRDRPKLSAGRGRGGQSARLPSPLVSNPRDRQKLSVGRGRGGRAPPDAGGNQSNVPTSHAQLAQRLAEIKERFSATPSPKPAAAAGHRGSFERPLSAEAPRDPVKDFVAEIKERVSSPVEKVTSKFQKGNPDFKASEGVPANERLARIKERLSITPPPPERSPSRGPQPQTPAANSRLAQIKERLSFPAAKIKPPESPPPPPLAPILIAPQPSGFPASQKPHSKTAPTPVPRKTVEAPVSHRKATGAAGAVSGASGVNLGSEPGVSRGTAPAGSGAGAGQPGGVNEHQAEKSLKDRQVWKVPEKLQKLLDQGLVKDPPPAVQPPSAQAVQALNLMHGAAKLSKKQLQRLKVQAQESKELAELQGIVGMHNVPFIMQTYWDVKGQPKAADGAAPPSGEPLFPIHEQLKILRQVARKSRKKLGKLRKKEALQQRQQPSGGAEKPGAGHTVTGGVFAKTESEPGGAEGKSGQSGAGVTGGEGVSRALGSGAAAAEAALDQEGTQASGRGKYPRKRGGEWVGNGGNARESGVERMAEGRITGPNGVVAEADTNVAVVIPAGSGASGLVKAGPGPDGSGKPTVSERSKVSGAPVMKEAVLRTGHEKILSEEPVILGGDGHELAPAKRKGPVLAQGKVGGLSEPHQNSANVSNDTARSEKSGAPVTIAPGDSTAGAQVGAKPGERKDEGGVPRLKGQSEAVRGLEEGISQPTSGVESRTEGVGQGNGGARDAEVLGLWETMTVTGKRKAVGGTESAASKKQAVGSVGEAGASKGLREDIPKGGGSQRTESSSSAIARTEPALSEREAGPRFQPGVSRAQSERGLLAKQESVKSVGVSGVGNEGRPASSGFNNAAQLSDEKSLRLEKGGGTGAQVLAQRLEPSAAKVVQKATPSAIFQTAPPLAVPSSARRSPPGGGVSETLPLVSAPPGVAKPPAVDAGFLAELRAKALASQQKKASEATVKPSESTVKVSETTVGVSARTVRESEVMVKPSTSAVKPSGTTVKASGGTARGPEEAAEPCGATIRVSKPTVRVAEGKARASETVVKSLGTTAKAFETVKQCAAVVATASRTATTPSKGAAKWSEGAETVSEGAEKASEAAEKASEAAAPVRASQWTAVASAALISARTTSAGTIPNKPTGVSEAGSQQLTGKSPAVPTLSLGPNPAAATISPAKASPPIGLPQPAPGQNAGQANPPLVSRPVFPGAPKPALHFGSAVKSHSTTDPPKVKPPHSQPGLPVTSSSPLKTAVLSAPQASAFGRTAPFISGALGTNLAFGSGATSKPGPSAPLTGSRPVLAQSLHEGIGGHSLPGSQTAEPPGKGAPEDALAATIKALRESIQRQSHVGFPSPVKIAGPKPSNQELPRGTEGALPGGGAPEQTRRLAYIKKRKNVLVRRVTPQRGTLTQSSRPDSASESGAGLSGNKGAAAELSSWGGASAGKMTPGGSKRQVARGVGRQPGGTGAGARKTPVGKAVHQRKALSWQRASAAPGATSTASPHTPLLQGPRRKQGARFASPQPKRGLTWKLGGPVAPGGSPKLGRNTLRMPGRGSRGFGKLSAKKTGVWGAAKAGKLGGAQSAVKRRAALKWSREKGTARTPGRASPLPISNEKGSLLTLLRQLRGQRSYTSTYAKSTDGLSLKRTGAVGLKGNLKWTLSGGKKRKEAAEKAAQAVRGSPNNGGWDPAGTSAGKRKAAAAARATARSKRALLAASLRRRPGAAPSNRERVVSVGLATYKMDATGRTLVRVSEPAPPGAFTPPATTPRRASVNGQSFVRQGTSDRLVIDPTSARKTLASGRLKWSLQNARRRKASKGETLCPYFTKYGKCNREGATCPFVHDRDKVAICTKFVLGRCENPDCTLTHKIIPERMPVCTYFLEGTCTNEQCPFRHVSVAPNAPVCREFLQGFCPRGDTCPHKHTSVCPKFAADGQCEEGDKCGFYHPTKRTWTLARALREAGRKRKRPRPVKPEIPPDLGEGGILLPPDDGAESEAPERPRARRRYFEADVSEVARKIKPAFLFDDP